MACSHGAASTCRGKNFVPFGACLGISFSQTRASHNKRDGLGREGHLWRRNDIRCLLLLSNFFEITTLPNRWDVPYRNHHACCEKLWFVRSTYPNLPQMGQKIYHVMLTPLHDSMPLFMNFRRALHLLEFENHVSQYLRPSDGGRVFEIHSYFLHGT